MSDPAVAAAFASHQPWITKYELRGASSGGWFDAPNDARLGLFRRCFPEARRILELGSLEGGHTIGLARLPGIESVLGVEGRGANLERARLAKELYEFPRLSSCRRILSRPGSPTSAISTPFIVAACSTTCRNRGNWSNNSPPSRPVFFFGRTAARRR